MENSEKLSSIKEEIKRQAENEIKEIKESVSREISKLKESYESKKQKFIKEKELEFEREGELIRKEIVTEKKLELKKKLINKKRELIEEVFNDVIERLKKQEKKEYCNLMENLLKETVSTKDEEIMPSVKDKVIDKNFINSINKKYGWKIKLGDKIAGIEGGFILKKEEYETVVNWPEIKEFIRQAEEETVVENLFPKMKNIKPAGQT